MTIHNVPSLNTAGAKAFGIRRLLLSAFNRLVVATLRRNVQGASALDEQDRRELAVGDIIQLWPGETLAADVRIIESHNLHINRARVTGEAPCCTALSSDNDIGLMGTQVISGTASAVVIATGNDTVFGAFTAPAAVPRRSSCFSILTGLRLAQVAQALLERKVLVKRLGALHQLGRMDVLCTDKTGTLSENRLVLAHHLDSAGVRCPRVLQLAWLNSFHQHGLKSPTDKAVLRLAKNTRLFSPPDDWRKIGDRPVAPHRQRASTWFEDCLGNTLVVCSGAPDEILDRACSVRTGAGVTILDEQGREQLTTLVSSYQQQGFHVRLVATRNVPARASMPSRTLNQESEQVIEGLLVFLDPPKTSAAPMLNGLLDIGIVIKVLSGDSPTLTTGLCNQLGLVVGKSLLGADIDALDDQQLVHMVAQYQVFARLTPQHKARVIAALQASGHVVGFMGDGINDVPALLQADAGIAVHGAAACAITNADILLLDDDLTTLDTSIVLARQAIDHTLVPFRKPHRKTRP